MFTLDKHALNIRKKIRIKMYWVGERKYLQKEIYIKRSRCYFLPDQGK